MIAGTIYGVVLNDVRERDALAPSFGEAPYKAPPEAPVVYIKPRNCQSGGGAPIPLPPGIERLSAAATLALLFARDVTAADAGTALASVAAASLAIDVCVPHDSYYRPAISQRCRDGFLPLGGFAPLPDDAGRLEIVTAIDGIEAHRWSLDRLVRPLGRLVADLSAFMTLRAGDVLLVGLPGDAPLVGLGQDIAVAAAGLPPLRSRVEAEALA